MLSSGIRCAVVGVLALAGMAAYCGYRHRMAWLEWRQEQAAILTLPADDSHATKRVRLYPWWHQFLLGYYDDTPYYKVISYQACEDLSSNGHIASICQLRDVRTLVLGMCKIDDVAADRILQLPNLETVVLSENDLSDSGFRNVGGTRSLRALSLDDTHVTDKTVTELSSLPLLSDLSLARTEISDGCIRDLCRLKSIRTIDISGTSITQYGVTTILDNCRNLTRLRISDKQFPREAWTESLRTRIDTVLEVVNWQG